MIIALGIIKTQPFIFCAQKLPVVVVSIDGDNRRQPVEVDIHSAKRDPFSLTSSRSRSSHIHIGGPPSPKFDCLSCWGLHLVDLFNVPSISLSLIKFWSKLYLLYMN